MMPKKKARKKKVIFYPSWRVMPKTGCRNAHVVVFDVLRATTSMIAALRAGVKCIIPCATIADARHTAQRLRAAGTKTLLAGERKGLPPQGFDLGNSPAAFAPARKQVVVMATTNGTRALSAVSGAREVLIGCLNNLSAVVKYLCAKQADRIVLLAAGEPYGPAAEDTFTAGLFMQMLLRNRGNHNVEWWLYAQAEAALRLAVIQEHSQNIEGFLRNTSHGRDLIRMGLEHDIAFAAQKNTTRIIGKKTAGGIMAVP